MVTLTGIREFFLLAFIHVGSRKVLALPATTNPTEDWCWQQAAVFLQLAERTQLPAKDVFPERDSKFGTAFDKEFAKHGVKGDRVACRAPNLNAYIERWIQSIEVEMLDHFIVFGETQVNHLVQSYVEFCRRHRPHRVSAMCGCAIRRSPMSTCHARQTSVASARSVDC